MRHLPLGLSTIHYPPVWNPIFPLTENNLFLRYCHHSIYFFALKCYPSQGLSTSAYSPVWDPNVSICRKKPFSIGYAAIGIAPIASQHPVSFVSETQHNR